PITDNPKPRNRKIPAILRLKSLESAPYSRKTLQPQQNKQTAPNQRGGGGSPRRTKCQSNVDTSTSWAAAAARPHSAENPTATSTPAAARVTSRPTHSQPSSIPST